MSGLRWRVQLYLWQCSGHPLQWAHDYCRATADKWWSCSTASERQSCTACLHCQARRMYCMPDMLAWPDTLIVSMGAHTSQCQQGPAKLKNRRKFNEQASDALLHLIDRKKPVKSTSHCA